MIGSIPSHLAAGTRCIRAIAGATIATTLVAAFGSGLGGVSTITLGLGLTLVPGAAQAARPGGCGHLGQRPCKLWEFIPSCEKGLTELGTCRNLDAEARAAKAAADKKAAEAKAAADRAAAATRAAAEAAARKAAEAKAAADRATAEAKAAADRKAAEAKAAADKAAAASRAAAGKAAADAKVLADKAAADAKALADKTAAAVKAAAEKSAADMKASADKAEAAGTAVALASIKRLNASLDAAKQELGKSAAKAALSKYAKFIAALQNNIAGLGPNHRTALNRIAQKITSRQLDAELRADLMLLGTGLGLMPGQPNSLRLAEANSIMEREVRPFRTADWVMQGDDGLIRAAHSIRAGEANMILAADAKAASVYSYFGVFVQASGGVVGGGASNWAAALGTYMLGDTYPVALTTQIGGAIGYQRGADVQVGIFWGPGQINESGLVGVGGGADLKSAGGSVGVSWNVKAGMENDPYAGIPGYQFGVSKGFGFPVNATVQGGYGWVLACTWAKTPVECGR